MQTSIQLFGRELMILFNFLEWKGFNTELEIEACNLRMAIGNRTATLKGAVIFLEGFDGDDFRDSQRFHYKLRFTNSLAYTSELFPGFQLPGPNFCKFRQLF